MKHTNRSIIILFALLYAPILFCTENNNNQEHSQSHTTAIYQQFKRKFLNCPERWVATLAVALSRGAVLKLIHPYVDACTDAVVSLLPKPRINGDVMINDCITWYIKREFYSPVVSVFDYCAYHTIATISPTAATYNNGITFLVGSLKRIFGNPLTDYKNYSLSTVKELIKKTITYHFKLYRLYELIPRLNIVKKTLGVCGLSLPRRPYFEMYDNDSDDDGDDDDDSDDL